MARRVAYQRLSMSDRVSRPSNTSILASSTCNGCLGSGREVEGTPVQSVVTPVENVRLPVALSRSIWASPTD